MQVPGREIEKLTSRELTAMRRHAIGQVTKLQQALASLNQSMIQHSLLAQPPPPRSQSADITSAISINNPAFLGDTDRFVDAAFAFGAQGSTLHNSTADRAKEAKQFVGAISLLLHDFEQQRDAATAEMRRRAIEKRENVAHALAQNSADLDATVTKDVKRHLQNAEASQYELQASIAAHNRLHEGKVAEIRKQVREQRKAAFDAMLRNEKKKQQKDEELQRKREVWLEEHRQKAAAKEAKLAEKLAAFDRSRMATLESGPRTSGDLVKELLATTTKVVKPDPASGTSVPAGSSGGDNINQGAMAVGSHRGRAHRTTSPQYPDAESLFSPGVLERLTKHPPRGYGIKKELDTIMDSHLNQAERNRQFIMADTRDRRERREKLQDRHFTELFRDKEQRWKDAEQQLRDEEARMASIKAAQQETLEQLSILREEKRRAALDRATYGSPPLVDHWASRARTLIESACRAAIVPLDELVRPAAAGGSAPRMDAQRRPTKGFERSTSTK